MWLLRRAPGQENWSPEGRFATHQTRLIYRAAAALADVFGTAYRVVSGDKARVLSIYAGGRWVDDPTLIAERPVWAADVPRQFARTQPAGLDDFVDTVALPPRKDSP